MSISIPGPVFSSLIFHLKNAPSDAEGFFLGSLRSHHVENITDSQSSGLREEKKVYIESFVTYSERYEFYDHFGRPHTDRLTALLGEEAQNVVGWFCYRRNTTHRLSLRERVVHRRLMECFTAVSNRDFLFGLVTEQILDQSAVQSTDYSFYNWIGTSLKLVRVDILNLQVTATIPYQLLPITHIPSSLPQYSSVLQEHKSKFTNSTGHMIQAQMAEQLYKSVLERLKPLCDQLSEATAAVVEEGRQVGELEAELERLMEEEKGTQSDDSAKLHPSTAPDSLTSVSHGNTTEHPPTAVPLIDFETEPVATRLIAPVGPVVDLRESLQEPPNLVLSQGRGPLINLSNNNSGNATKPLVAAPNYWPGGVERGEEEEGIVMANPNADMAVEAGEGEGEGEEGEGEEVRGEVMGELVSGETAEPVQGSQQELF